MDVNIEIDELVLDGDVSPETLADRIRTVTEGALNSESAAQVAGTVRAEAWDGQPPGRWEPL